jgi:Mg-chelatase subunit ChlD
MVRIAKYTWFVIAVMLLVDSRQVFATEQANNINDVRILIDVSGSMKKNDPKNLRVPALKMLVELMPEEDKAGVWTFARYVNMLVPIKPVSKEWRLKANQQTNQIHSLGLFTDIEQVLTKATNSMKEAESNQRRSIILLSDGLVDLHKGEQASKASRQRIIDELIPRFKALGITVHTIALSDNADHQLLKSISMATDGWYEQVDTAEALQRIFLHLFEKSTKRDTVPINAENSFKIDDSVTEMTLLVFRKEGSPKTELTLPDQSKLSAKNASFTVRWHSEANYDLVTIDNPMSGSWMIDADVDPDNRVMVVTDMQLVTNDLPNNILMGEGFDVEASLTEKGNVITRVDFLKLVDAKVIEENEFDYPLETSVNESLSDGVYRRTLGDSFKPGRNDVVVTMTSATFERQRRQSINVIDNPLNVYQEQLDGAVSRTHRIVMTPDETLIVPEGLSISAMLTAEDGSEWSYDVTKNQLGEWQLTLADLIPQQIYSLALQLKATTTKGREVFLQPSPIQLIDRNIPAIEPELDTSAAEESNQNDVEPEMPAEEESIFVTASDEGMEQEGGDEAELEQLDEEETSFSLNILMIGNAIILLIIGVGVFMWRRQSAAQTNPGDEL